MTDELVVGVIGDWSPGYEVEWSNGTGNCDETWIAAWPYLRNRHR